MAEFLTMQEAEDLQEKSGMYVDIITRDNAQYTDCKGNVRLVTEETSTILASPATSETITTLVPEVNKVIDVIIPNGVSIVNQAILDELPTSLPVKGNCAYSVFEIQIPAATSSYATSSASTTEDSTHP